MDARLVNPFIAALSDILPQLGFKNVVRGNVFVKPQFIDCLGVAVQVALTHQVNGSVVFNMTEEAAKGLSSVMMMGASVTQFDDMAQSAICEMVNMITSNAANALSQSGIAVKLKPPALSQSNSQFKVCDSNYIGIEMTADALSFEVGIGIN
jgi:chemotaxis protein CheX